MTDTVKSWIEQRRTAHEKATEGPWETNDWGDLTAGSDLLLVGTATSEGNFADPDDAIATVDAHNMFPAALNALEQVLELHVPAFGSNEIDWCDSCDRTWPCETVQAIEGAINE